MTTIEQTTKDGKPGIKVTCDCATHAAGANGAVITGPAAAAIAARKGKNKDERIHGFVTLANHPAAMMRQHNASQGIFAL